MGRRVSIQLITGLGKSLLCRPAMIASQSGPRGAGSEGEGRGAEGSADLDFGVGLEGVRRHVQVQRCRPMSHAPGGVVLAAVAGAEPAAPVAARIGRLVAQRDAAEMGAYADQDDPLVVA